VADRRVPDIETPELRRLRRRIDALDRRIVALLNERAELAREAGRAKTAAGRRAIRDAEREREVLLRVTMANTGPVPQADLLTIYRRLMSMTRALEARDRARVGRPTATAERPMIRRGDAARTRFAPAPTGYLHLGHVANAIHVWGLAAEAGARVLLRIEDHDRIRCRPEYDAPCSRTSPGSASASTRDPCASRPTTARTPTRSNACVPPASCTAAPARVRRSSAGPRTAALRGTAPAVPASAAGSDWTALSGASRSGAAPSAGWTCSSVRARTRSRRAGIRRSAIATELDVPPRGRRRRLRQGVDLVVRGRDLLASTPAQIRLGHLLGRESRRPSPITRSSAGPTAASCRSRRAIRASASSGRPVTARMP
jgi:chorismate mutase